MLYVQCTLRKGNTHQVAWIPEFSKNRVKVRSGHMVSLQQEDGSYDMGWDVLNMSPLRQSDSIIRNREHSRRSAGAFPSLNKSGGRL